MADTGGRDDGISSDMTIDAKYDDEKFLTLSPEEQEEMIAALWAQEDRLRRHTKNIIDDNPDLFAEGGPNTRKDIFTNASIATQLPEGMMPQWVPHALRNLKGQVEGERTRIQEALRDTSNLPTDVVEALRTALRKNEATLNSADKCALNDTHTQNQTVNPADIMPKSPMGRSTYSPTSQDEKAQPTPVQESVSSQAHASAAPQNRLGTAGGSGLQTMSGKRGAPGDSKTAGSRLP